MSRKFDLIVSTNIYKFMLLEAIWQNGHKVNLEEPEPIKLYLEDVNSLESNGRSWEVVVSSATLQLVSEFLTIGYLVSLL